MLKNLSVTAAKLPLLSLIVVSLFGSIFADNAHAENYLREEPAFDQKFTIVDSTERLNKRVFLKNYRLGDGVGYWIDNDHMLVGVRSGDGYDASKTNIPKWIKVNIETGEIEDIGIRGGISCYADGQAVVHPKIEGAFNDRTMMVGTLGGDMQTFPEGMPRGKRLNINCQLVDSEKVKGSTTYLKEAHGRITEDDTFYRQDNIYKDNIPNRLYLRKPDGQEIDIPTNPGERNFSYEIKYIPFENAYLLTPEFGSGDSTKRWQPRYPLFVRLLYPDGSVKRFSMPNVHLFSKLRGHSATFKGVLYTKRGLVWRFKRNPKPPTLGLVHYREVRYDDFLQSGNELIQGNFITQSPDGCKLVGEIQSRFSDKLSDYYVTNLCEDK